MPEEVFPEFVLGSETSDFLRVRALKRAHPTCNDYWDGNWIRCNVEVIVGGFRGTVNEDLRSEEFAQFHDQLRILYERLTGKAAFGALEGWLEIDVAGDGYGHLTAKCELVDQPGTGNRLTFEIGFDQTYLPSVIAGLEKILAAFPVMGHRTK